MVTTKKVRCIFCGSLAWIKNQNRLKVVCPSCKRGTELDNYREMCGLMRYEKRIKGV